MTYMNFLVYNMLLFDLQWMGRSIEIHQRALAEYPEMSSETRTMTEQLVFDWK